MNPVKSLSVTYHSLPVGKLALDSKGLCVFEYDTGFLKGNKDRKGFSISPFELPLRPGVHFAKPYPFEGGFGVFDDALPDGWGLLVLDRFLQKKGINPRSLTLLDRLSLVGSSGRGALEFVPDQSLVESLNKIDFPLLAAEAQKILSSDTYEGSGIDEFQLRGGSPGGARPKIFTNYQGKEWLVKFRAKNDPENIGEIEYNYSLLAKKCGIEMPETKLFEGKYFGVERFDRIGSEKVHVVSIAGLLGADYRIPSLDYYQIFQVGMALTNSFEEMWKIYRLMVFNYLIGNKDDHAKNFAFIFWDNSWHFAPAYDLLPSSGINGYHTTSINDSIEPQRKDLIELAVKVNLDKRKAESIFDEMSTLMNSAK